MFAEPRPVLCHWMPRTLTTKNNPRRRNRRRKKERKKERNPQSAKVTSVDSIPWQQNATRPVATYRSSVDLGTNLSKPLYCGLIAVRDQPYRNPGMRWTLRAQEGIAWCLLFGMKTDKQKRRQIIPATPTMQCEFHPTKVLFTEVVGKFATTWEMAFRIKHLTSLTEAEGTRVVRACIVNSLSVRRVLSGCWICLTGLPIRSHHCRLDTRSTKQSPFPLHPLLLPPSCSARYAWLIFLCLEEATHKGDNYRSKDVTQTQQQRPESPTVILTWRARYINSAGGTSSKIMLRRFDCVLILFR